MAEKAYDVLISLEQFHGFIGPNVCSGAFDTNLLLLQHQIKAIKSKICLNFISTDSMLKPQCSWLKLAAYYHVPVLIHFIFLEN